MGNVASHGLHDGVVSKKALERMQRRCAFAPVVLQVFMFSTCNMLMRAV